MSEYQTLFNRLWHDYTTQNPNAKSVHDLFTQHNETVVNDHIAFRTFNHSRTNISVLAKPFLAAGYQPAGYYQFADKHLIARHYEHISDKTAPRVFISELLLEEFSENLQNDIHILIDKLPDTLLSSPELLLAGNPWGPPSYRTYENLRKESEYAAWLYVYGFRANHFTISVNHLKTYNTLQKVNTFLKTHGFLLNNAGGEIKGSPEQFLEQSSIKAGILPVQFIEGRYDVPSCYYEFALRYPDATGHLFSGFIAGSADKIFESTNYYQK